MKDFDFFGKKMRVAYAKNKSNIIAKRDGTFQMKKRKIIKEIDDKMITNEANDTIESKNQDENEIIIPENPPSNILMLQNVPTEVTELMLSILFRQFDGFKEARLAINGIAFVEFYKINQASTAMDKMQGFQITEDKVLKIMFAKS